MTSPEKLTDSQTLLPCPFCGATNAMMFEPTCRPETPYNPADRLFPIVRCMTCYAEAAGDNEDYRGGTAIARWNRRTPIESSTEPVATILEDGTVCVTLDEIEEAVTSEITRYFSSPLAVSEAPLQLDVERIAAAVRAALEFPQ